MTSTSTYITIGKIGSAYGVHGWLKVQSFTEYSAHIFDYQPWYLTGGLENNRTLALIEETRLQGERLLVKFVGIDTPEAAKRLTGQTIEIDRNQLPRLNPHEFYWSDLIGLRVINQRGELLGTVSYLMETGSNDVLVIKNGKEHAIPYLFGTVIEHIDLDKGEIHVNWELI